MLLAYWQRDVAFCLAQSTYSPRTQLLLSWPAVFSITFCVKQVGQRTVHQATPTWRMTTAILFQPSGGLKPRGASCSTWKQHRQGTTVRVLQRRETCSHSTSWMKVPWRGSGHTLASRHLKKHRHDIGMHRFYSGSSKVYLLKKSRRSNSMVCFILLGQDLNLLANIWPYREAWSLWAAMASSTFASSSSHLFFDFVVFFLLGVARSGTVVWDVSRLLVVSSRLPSSK